jgi:hypothetical protein
MDLGFVIGGMDIGLHDVLSSDAVRAGHFAQPVVAGVSGD